MSIEYNVMESIQHGKKKRHMPKSDTDFALKKRNAVVAEIDGTKQRQKITFFRLID